MPDAKSAHAISPFELTTLDGVAPAKYVNVKVEHFLPTAAPGVDEHDAVAHPGDQLVGLVAGADGSETLWQFTMRLLPFRSSQGQ
jgi:hypothetical protein